jgi:hypothetical protein
MGDCSQGARSALKSAYSSRNSSSAMLK